MHWMLMPFRRVFDYSGRSGRKEFTWFFVTFWFVIPVSFAALYPALTGGVRPDGGSEWLAAIPIVMFLLLVPTISLLVRRVHDVDWSGWWLLTMVLPIFWIIPVILIWAEGAPGPNRFGPEPGTARRSW